MAKKNRIEMALVVLILVLVITACEEAAAPVDEYVVTGKINGTAFTFSAGPSDGNSEPLASYNNTQSESEVYASNAVFAFANIASATDTLIIKDINLAGTGTDPDATLVYYLEGTAHTTANAATVTITAYGTNQGETVTGTFSGTAGSYTFSDGAFTAWYGGPYDE